MRTNYCPHCASDRVVKIDESDGSHFHECEDCQEAWEHHNTKAEYIPSSKLSTNDQDNSRSSGTHKHVVTP